MMRSIPAALLLAVCGCAEPAGKPRPAPPPAAPATDKLPAKLRAVSKRLATALAASIAPGKAVAVLPLADTDGGVTRLGAVLGEGIEAELRRQGLAVVDRAHLNRLLDEVDLQMALTGDAKQIGRGGKLSGADVLIVGRTVDAGKSVLCSAKAVDVRTSRVLADADGEALPRPALGRLMWYVRRPAKTDAGGELPPLAIRYELISPGAAGERRLADGATVRSGQKFKIRVQPNSDCHLYVLLYDSQGQAGVLFPHRKIGLSNAVRGGVSYEIPEAAKWYWFDKRPGVETFYLVAGYTPLTNLDSLLAKMQATAGHQHVKLARQARTEIDTAITRGMSRATAGAYRPKGFQVVDRGVGGVVDLGPGASRPAAAPSADDIAVGLATVVKKVTLHHR